MMPVDTRESRRWRYGMTRAFLRRGAMIALLWWVLAEGRSDGWPFGVAAVMATAWVSLLLMPPVKQGPRLAGVPGFLAFFLRGGLQALRGRAALRPAVVELRLVLPPDGPRILMTGVLGLLPGTLGVELADDRLPMAAEAKTLERRIATLVLALLAAIGGIAFARRAVAIHGDAAPQILEQGEEQGADLIVFGKHGMGMAEELLLGSVTKYTLALPAAMS